ncbi:Ribosome biogenesis protein Alb1 [Trypanosoma melophagium]|uniref:Ribosome biogenesis protein Alb1 n=1 Tax=Trypanosoma melophagium TaxID=715481 RepID=UPI003519F66C|nr:Ribosome biogenesis protein Alb1 [Trypanosoma melophagium]
MTKLVRKLKQMAKKRAHRKTVQKRRMEREQKKLEDIEKKKAEQLERETDLEMQRLGYGRDATEGNVESTTTTMITTTTTSEEGKTLTKEDNNSEINKKIVRVVGGLVLEAPQRKAKKQISRKQVKRKEKAQERGRDVAARLDKKWDSKKRRVKMRAQIRNLDLHN